MKRSLFAAVVLFALAVGFVAGGYAGGRGAEGHGPFQAKDRTRGYAGRLYRGRGGRTRLEWTSCREPAGGKASAAAALGE